MIRRFAAQRRDTRDAAVVDPATLLRAVRRARRMSQRELAALAKVRPSTIDRIESGQTASPSLAVIEKILMAAGYRFQIIGRGDRIFDVDEPHDGLVDRAGRNYPAHLRLHRLRSTQDRWWGWFRIAWMASDPAVPQWIYYHRDDQWSWLDERACGWPWYLLNDIT